TDTLQIEYEILEKKPRYIIDLELQHPNCLFDGDIVLILESPGEGNYEIMVFGPEEDLTFHTSEDRFQLAENGQVISGQYLFTVKDLSLNCDLADSIQVELTEEELPLELEDDHYELLSGETIVFNVLDNDEGTGLRLIEIEAPQFGILQWEENGEATFSSTIPEHGLVSVIYTVEDSCGTSATAVITIEVTLPPCDFEVEFIVEDASCGFEDGEIAAVVMPPGDYTYTWSNGATTATVKNLPTGMYTLTVTDNLLQCDLVFSTEVGEMESNWIQDYEVYPFGCSNDPDIVLNLHSPDNGLLEVTVTGGEIFNQKITIPSGEVNLKDHFWLTTGQYTIVVVPVGSKPRCSETIVVQLSGVANPIDIELLQSVSPSGPNQTDGSIQIKINDVHTPFDLFLNGDFIASINQSTYTFSNLGVGTYEIYASNSQNCTSESIVVELVAANSLQLVQHFSTSSATTDWPSFSEIRSRLAEKLIAEDVGYMGTTEAWSRRMFPSRLLGMTLEKDLGFNRYIYLQLEHRQGGEIWGTSEGTEYHFNWGITRAGLGMGSQFDIGKMKINTSIGGVGNSFYGGLISQSSQSERPLKLTEEYGSLEMSLGMSYPLFEKTLLRMSWKYYQLLNLDDRPGLLLIELSREF
nr:hypothetical protein [Saprospiraceae bacterium]